MKVEESSHAKVGAEEDEGEKQKHQFHEADWLFVTEIRELSKTKRNSTQNNSEATSVGVRHSSQVFPPPPPHPTTNFPATSRPARELKFGTDTH